jgi:tRNA-specific adenosine deaminase 3
MLHVRTKEECRLANETVDVWSIELPSKHAESILKSVSAAIVAVRHSYRCRSLTILTE